MKFNEFNGKLNAVWGKNLSSEMNLTLAFTLDMKKVLDFDMQISASSCYKIFVDGKFIAFGPQRAAHGYQRVQEYKVKGQKIVVLVHHIGAENFWLVFQPPYFACRVKADGVDFNSKDFNCYLLDDRVKKVQRYSYQRGFTEVYDVIAGKENIEDIEKNFSRVEVEEVSIPKLLNSLCPNPNLNIHLPKEIIDCGGVSIDKDKNVWRDRIHYAVGDKKDGAKTQGFKVEEWEAFPTDEACKFIYHVGEKNGELLYKTYDFGRGITGFISLKVKAQENSVIYFIFDEILIDDKKTGDNVDFTRNTCSSVFKWTIKEAGEYNLSTFEPYTVRYGKVVYSSGVEIEPFMQDYQNPDIERFKFTSSDEDLNKIVCAAKETLAQNAVDLLTDCPSRERSGWLADSWFSSVAEKTFTGENNAERTFLENYVDYMPQALPKGILPMNYPSDDYDGMYIPNWDMWYILEVIKYASIYKNDEIVNGSKDNIYGILGYFESKENEFGLLEDLESWVFVEWSAANDQSHIQGVNIPSNFCYAHCLELVGKTYNDNNLLQKAKKVKKAIKEMGFDGKFFVDNLVRNEKGELVRTNNLTEVCQYYGFWFNVIDKTEYSDLYEELMLRLGTERKEGYMPNIEKPNVMYGIYMRLDLLLRDGEREKVIKEVKKIFTPMAEKTGTLWEHNSTCASCNHGFASYAIRWIIFALTGYDVLEDTAVSQDGLNIDCEISFPKGACRYRSITVKNNIVKAE